MKKLSLVLAATAAVAAAPAAAATFLTASNSSPAVCTGADATCNFTIAGSVEQAGEFRVTSNVFFLPTTGTISGVATNTATGSTNIDFTGVTLTNNNGGQFFTTGITNGFFDLAFFGPASVEPGLFTLTLVGNAVIDAVSTPPSYPSIGGTASFDAAVAGAVPEPATWALFIAGFGAIGGALRRRASQIRVSKAKPHFA